jgi:ribonuclease HII
MIGIDEVGRGAWAGPLLVVAARLKRDVSLPDGLTDSKLLSHNQKNEFYEQLLYTCQFGEGWVSVSEIDEFGLGASLKIGAARAVAELGDFEREEIIIDGNVDLLGDDYPLSRAVVQADINEPIVSAASVYAKVVRDRYMTKLHYTFPAYGFKDHVGYGTQKHIDALKKHGVSEHHRKSFKPIMQLL